MATLVSLVAVLFPARADAAAGINQQINFQGRLLTSQGAVVPDGFYNIQFKIYQDGNGQTAGNPSGTLEWTESHLNANSQGVKVYNGFLSVQLGSVTPFGSSVDWDQDTLWLSMNIAGTNVSCTPFTSCTPDGEMVPMKRLAATPYALNAGRLGGLTSAGFIQNTTNLQTANIALQSAGAADVGAIIQGASSQTADILQIKANGTATPLLAVGANGAVTLKNATNSTTAFQIQPSGSTTPVLNVDTQNSRVGIGNNAPAYKLDVTAGTNHGLRIQTTDNDQWGLMINNLSFGNTNATGFGLWQDLGGTGHIINNGSNMLSVASDGSVGINNSGPAYALDVGGSINTTVGYRVSGTLGATTTCSGGTFLQNAVTIGGITTGGTCVAASNGVTTVGTFSASSIANGASIAGTTITFGAADGSNPGMVSTVAQTFAGAKTFNAIVNAGAGINVATSQAYQINNVNTVTAAALTFSDTSTTSSVSSAAGQGLNVNGATGTTIQTNGVTRATFDTSNNLYLGNGVTAAAPNSFTIRGTGSSTTGVAGGALTVQGGSATVGNANGGNLNLSGGAGFGTGAGGLVVITTPTFSTTANDANCYTGGALVTSTCTITAASLNGSSAIIVGFTVIGQIATLPDPTIATAGRVVYVTAANNSSDFTLRVNGGGQGNDIAMRQNTTATMIWNGSDWTAAGASSSTTLQSAYDNTLQSAGGAELIVSKTSNTNGLTIRDSLLNPVNGTLMSVQTSSAAGLLSVNSNVTEYVSNAGAETSGASSTTFPASTWTNTGAATVSRYATAGNFIATGQGSVSVATTAAANVGAKNVLTGALTANTSYNVSMTTRLSTGIFTDLNVYYSVDGTAASVACTTGAAVNTSVWTKVNCTFTTPASGIAAGNSILIRQTAASARTFYVDNLSVTIAADYNFAVDGSVNDDTNFATNWSYSTGTGTGTVTRSTADGFDASDSASVNITAGAVNAGVRNRLGSNPLPDTLYRVTVYARLTSGTFNDFKVRYSRNAGTNFVDCVDYNTQTVTTAGWTKITCYIKTDVTTATSPYVYFAEGSAVARTFAVDNFSLTISTITTPNVQVGGGINGGPTTLFTLDKGASAPIASNNDALLGSMYYDTTLGKLQCYEADGWGACGSSPDSVVTVSPEYTNAVMHGTGVGTMTSDLCSDTLNINDGSSSQPTICGTNETYNFYKWTSPQPSAQTYGIYVTYQLPSTFKEFASGQTSLMGRTDSANATVTYQIYRSSSSGLTACGAAVTVSTGVQTSWQTAPASGAADPSTCGFLSGESIVVRINTTASGTANAYVGNLNFTFSNR